MLGWPTPQIEAHVGYQHTIASHYIEDRLCDPLFLRTLMVSLGLVFGGQMLPSVPRIQGQMHKKMHLGVLTTH